LDYEDEKIWLGIMVSDNEVGKQIGNQIMDDLIQQTTDIIYLSVDINNERGLKLYNKKGFEVITKTEDHYIMKLNK
jgi:ribosomal protein S18 acetylase RimI-like enzyme